ncbi:MAG: radical SAM family heme chaperone HemW [Gemmatimonadaceae bacterium]
MRPRHIYVHVPFCARRCAYCDFSIAVRRQVPGGEYVDAVRRELAIRFAGDDRWDADTLYFGGGTPSRLSGAEVIELIGALRKRVTLGESAEVTLEANPEDVTTDAVSAWHDAGVNRVSLGAQSFDDRVLTWMHRSHDSAAIGRAVDTLRRGGIENLSLDLIFALPTEIDRDWADDVRRALELGPEHLSLYGLTVEPHTPMGRWRARGELVESPEEQYEVEFLHAHDAVCGAGLEHYEVSNFGRPGRHSRHNSAYWALVPYAVVGPSAHEFDGSARRWNLAVYRDWARAVNCGQDPIAGSETVGGSSRVAEEVYLGLRSRAGLTLKKPELSRVAPWIEAGWANLDDGWRMTLTPLGWLRLDALAADLTLVRSHY